MVCMHQDEDVPPTDPASTPLEAAEKAVAFYQQIQSEDGHWAMDYGGPMFLMPGTWAAASRSKQRRGYGGCPALTALCTSHFLQFIYISFYMGHLFPLGVCAQDCSLRAT